MTIIRQRFGRGNAVDPVVWRRGSVVDPVMSRPVGGPHIHTHPTLPTNLLFCYECDDNAASSVVVDSTGSVNGTLKGDNGGALVATNTDNETIAGKIASAFWGTRLGVNATRCVDFTAVEGGAPGTYYHINKDFSWNMWIRWPSLVGGGGANARANLEVVIGNWGGAGAYCQIGWYNVGATWRQRWLTWDGTFRGVYTSTDVSTFDDVWWMLSATYDASAAAVNVEDGMKLYVNGSDVTVKMAVGGRPATGFQNNAWIYNHRPDANFPARFDMDQFCSWNKVLTSSECSDMWNGGAGMPY